MRIHMLKVSLLAGAAIWTNMGLAGIAAAQSAPVQSEPGANPAVSEPLPNSGEGGDIIVQARRRDERLQDVPAVVNAVTSEQLQRLNFRNFTEVANVVPGLQLTNNANGIGGNAQLRGVNFDVNASGNNPTVEFYFNDASITAGVILQQLYDIGQIEVQRGPQGTLRGRSSPSGSITVISHRPDLNRFGGYVDLTANDIGTQNVQGALNVPVVSGIFALRFAGVVNQDNANGVHTINRTQDARDPYSETVSGRVSAIFTPTDFLRFEGTYQTIDSFTRSWDQVESFNQVNPAAAASPVTIRARDRLSDNDSPRYVDQTFNIYNARAQLSLMGQQLIYQFQHYDQNVRSRTDTDFANRFPGLDLYQVNHLISRSESHEVRLQNQARVGGFLDYVVGYFDSANAPSTNLTQATAVTLPAFLGGSVQAIARTPIFSGGTTHEASYFGNVTIHIGNANAISGGLRYIQYRDTNALLINNTRVTGNDTRTHALIYNASVQHFFTPDVMVYASTGTSFRSGPTVIGDFNIAPSALERSFISLPAERSTSYEIGLKTQFLDHRLRFNVTGFHQTFRNYVYRQPGNGVYYVNTVVVPGNACGAPVCTGQQVGQFNFVGAVPVEVNGVEGEVAFDITRRFNIGVVASYSLGRIKNGTIACNDLDGDHRPDPITAAPTLAALQAAYGANNVGSCTANQRSAFQAPFSASVQAEYNQPITSGVNAYLRGLFSLQGRSQGNPNYQFDNVRSFGLLNMYAGVRAPDGMWEINFFAKNLLDETRVLTRSLPLSTSYQVLQPPTFRTTAGANSSSTYASITTTPQREFGVNLRFRFGSR